MPGRTDRRRRRLPLAIIGVLTMVLSGCSVIGWGDGSSPASPSASSPAASSSAGSGGSSAGSGGSSSGSGGSSSDSSSGESTDGATGDEFDGPAGSAPDPSIWTAQTGDGGWGNEELQTYTSNAVALDGKGHLVITAKVGGTASDPTYTSGRITTQNKLEFTTGTLSARMKLPDGTGLLPAFWLLGADVDQVGWPVAGEVDVVETPNTTGTSSHNIHGPNKYLTTQDVTVSGDLTHDPKLSEGYHTFTVVRTADSVTTKVDGVVAVHLTRDTAPPTLEWVFDKPMNILFSLAIGGKWPGDPDASTPTTSRMLIDWIRYTPGT